MDFHRVHPSQIFCFPANTTSSLARTHAHAQMLAAGINERLHSACYAPDAVKCSSKRGACTDSASESVEGRLSKKKPMFGAENVAFSTQASAFAQAPVPAIAPPPPAPTATAAHASAFRILRHIQTGGHGCVYEAVLGGGKAPQRVAIKTTLPDDIETCRELEAVRKFASLLHP